MESNLVGSKAGRTAGPGEAEHGPCAWVGELKRVRRHRGFVSSPAHILARVFAFTTTMAAAAGLLLRLLPCPDVQRTEKLVAALDPFKKEMFGGRPGHFVETCQGGWERRPC